MGRTAKEMVYLQVIMRKLGCAWDGMREREEVTEASGGQSIQDTAGHNQNYGLWAQFHPNINNTSFKDA